MKATDLLKLIENSKGGKSAEGELKRPTYKNDKTPNNHVKGKKNRVVGNKIDKGEKRDGKKVTQITPPQKKERRSMEGPGTKVKTMEASLDVVKGNIKGMNDKTLTITVYDQNRGQNIDIPMQDQRKYMMMRAALKGNDEAQATRAYAALLNDPNATFSRSSFPGKEEGGFEKGAGAGGVPAQARAGRTGRAGSDRNVYQGSAADARAGADKLSLADSKGNRVRESGGEHSDAMSKKPTVDKKNDVSSSASVRTKQNDAPKPTADVGKPKGKEKRSMDANPAPVKDHKGGENEHKSMKKMHEDVTDLENWLGTSLNLNEGDMETFYMDDDQPMTCPHCGARTDFEGDGTQPAKHKCMNQKCGFEFMAEPYQEDDMDEANGGGKPPAGQVGQAKPSPMSRRGAAMRHHRDSGTIGGHASNYRTPPRRK